MHTDPAALVADPQARGHTPMMQHYHWGNFCRWEIVQRKDRQSPSAPPRARGT